MGLTVPLMSRQLTALKDGIAWNATSGWYSMIDGIRLAIMHTLVSALLLTYFIASPPCAVSARSDVLNLANKAQHIYINISAVDVGISTGG